MNANAPQHCLIELPFTATQVYADPYNEVELDVAFSGPEGAEIRVPAFWAGDNIWKVRFAGPLVGEYQYQTVCSHPEDAGLHGQSGSITITPYTGENPLLRGGRVRVAADRRHFEQQDGTPFFWLADTWWMGLSTRLDWPAGFKELAADRVAKGFNTVQIVAGPYPDMGPWDARGASDAGFPFTENFERINPAYYDLADLKIAHLVASGLMPCIVGMWGYYLPILGMDKVNRFWRYLVARYGAYPVTWCICGEAVMPYYLSQNKEADEALQRRGWAEVMRHVKEMDGHHNMITIHPTDFGRDMVEDTCLMDFEMLQTGHGDLDSVGPTMDMVSRACAREPRMPVINSEVNYEGILMRAWQNVQRLCFWHSVLRGAAGHTYGANGIWQMNGVGKPYGPSPHGRSWGDTPWAEAARLPGSRQVGLGARLLRRFPWWELERHPEWTNENGNHPYTNTAVGIPGKLRLIYAPMAWDAPPVKGLEQNAAYRAWFFDPCTGQEIALGPAIPDGNGDWAAPPPPACHDWVLVLEAQ